MKFINLTNYADSSKTIVEMTVTPFMEATFKADPGRFTKKTPKPLK